MNSDIRIAVSFKGHRKRKKLIKLIGHRGVCCLIDLWLGTAMSNPSGTLTAWDSEDIANESGWTGDPEKFVSALVECRFLEQDETGTFKLHDWADHQGYVVHSDKRRDKAKQAAEIRWKKRNTIYAPSMPVACNEQSSSNAPSPAPNPTPNPTPDPTPLVIKRNVETKEAFNAIDFKPDFFPENLWSAYLANRTFKKLQNSELALTTACNQFREATKKGYAIEECVGAFVEGGWKRFKVEWMENIKKNKNSRNQIVDEKAERARYLLGIGGTNDEEGHRGMGLSVGPDDAGAEVKRTAIGHNSGLH